MGEHDALLKRFQPVLRYDSNEQFFADSAAQYTDAPGITLRRAAPARDKAGAVLATSDGAGAEPKLTLDFLGPKAYGSGEPVEKGDHIAVRGRNYREQYVTLRMNRPDLNNVTYGHAIEANGRLWLQYWFWYFYNDYQLSFALGTHEGDWEMVQLRMDDEAGHPDLAVYSQHRYGEVRPWDEVETLGDRPVIYVARGSHAGYFEAGFHQTEAWYDLADGKRRMKHRPRLEILETDAPAWTRWPGRWGDSLPRNAIESNSPTGPGAKKQWTEPDKMLDNPAPKGTHGQGAKAPEVRALRAGRTAARRVRPHQARPAPPGAHRDGQLRGRGRRAAADAQHRRARRRARQGHDRHRARPAQALRRLHELRRRRSAGSVAVAPRRDRAVRRGEAHGLAAAAPARAGQHERSPRSAATGSGADRISTRQARAASMLGLRRRRARCSPRRGR